MFMRKLKSLTVYLGLFSLNFLFSCNVLEVTREYTYDLEYIVKSSGNEFSDELILDPYEESGDFETVEDKMESAEIIKIEYTVTYFNGPEKQVLELAEWRIADSLGSDPQLLCAITNVNLQSLTTEILELPMDPAGLSKFENMVEHANYVSLISLHGKTNSAPIDFILKFFVTVKITAQVI